MLHQVVSTPRLVAVLAGLVACLMQPGALMAQEAQMSRTITVSASGRVSERPDIVRLTAGMTTEASTAREALRDNNRVMGELLDALIEAEISEDDIQTSNFNVSPKYSRPKHGETAEITGYQVSNQVSVTVRKIERAGEIMDMLVRLGANQISGISFEVSDAERLKDRARERAIGNARRRAELLAAASGAEVGQVMTISEETTHQQPRPMAMRRTAVAESAVPVAAGSQELEARVTVTWELK